MSTHSHKDLLHEEAPDELARLSISLPADVLKSLDVMVSQRGLPSRSQFISELIRTSIVEFRASDPDLIQAGALSVVYRRGKASQTREQVMQVQTQYLKEVVSSQHVFLDKDQSLEVLIVQGPTSRLEALCDQLRSIKGVIQICLTPTAALLPPLH